MFLHCTYIYIYGHSWKKYCENSRDEDPDPVIFGPPDPDPVIFSMDPDPDPDPTCNNGFIKLFLFFNKI